MAKHGAGAQVRPVSNHTLQAEFSTTLPVYLPISEKECAEISISIAIGINLPPFLQRSSQFMLQPPGCRMSLGGPKFDTLLFQQLWEI